MVPPAEGTHFDHPVALKVMLPKVGANPATKERFLREAKAAAAVRHDNTVIIDPVGADRGAPLIACEFLEGAPLDQWLG